MRRKLANLIFRIRFAHWPNDPWLICEVCEGRRRRCPQCGGRGWVWQGRTT